MKIIAMLFYTTQIINISKNFETWYLAHKQFSLRDMSTAPTGKKTCLDSIKVWITESRLLPATEYFSDLEKSV